MPFALFIGYLPFEFKIQIQIQKHLKNLYFPFLNPIWDGPLSFFPSLFSPCSPAHGLASFSPSLPSLPRAAHLLPRPRSPAQPIFLPLSSSSTDH
jgi:hypothetical protein